MPSDWKPRLRAKVKGVAQSRAVTRVAAPLRRVIVRLQLTELVVLVPVLIVVLGIWLFIAIADEMREGDTQRVDEWASRLFQSVHDPAKNVGPAVLVEIARDVTALGSGVVLFLVVAIVCGHLVLARQFKSLSLVLVASAGGALLSIVLKEAFARGRPDLLPHLTVVMTASFPSGHSVMSTVVYLTLGVLLAKTTPQRSAKVYLIAVAMLISFLVGVSRIFLRVHFLTDVLAGWTLGLVWSTMCLLVATWLQRHGLIEPPGQPA